MVYREEMRRDFYRTWSGGFRGGPRRPWPWASHLMHIWGASHFKSKKKFMCKNRKIETRRSGEKGERSYKGLNKLRGEGYFTQRKHRGHTTEILMRGPTPTFFLYFCCSTDYVNFFAIFARNTNKNISNISTSFVHLLLLSRFTGFGHRVLSFLNKIIWCFLND